jgi:bifunctional oligoribonuclease and PAP phosphatase NrnA
VNKSILSAIGEKLHQSQNIMILTHLRPDGDAIGSLLGLGLSLQAAGKSVQMVSVDGVPAAFRHLAGSDKIVKRADGNFDLLIVVDCSDPDRVGNPLEGLRQPDISIDHHITNLNFAFLNLIETEAAATAEIIARCLPAWGFPVSVGVSDALLTGLISDTIGFRTSNVTGQVLRTAADLVEAGSNLANLYRKALLQKSYTAARYWGAGLSNLMVEDGIVWTTLTLADRKTANYPGRDDADLINMLSYLNEAEVAIVFIEQSDNVVKVSWRAQNGKDVSQVALRFGGGGHRAAAGAEVTGLLPDVQLQVLNATREIFFQEKVSDAK